MRFLGRTSDDKVKSYLEKCRGLIFPGREDFGIARVEAPACGKPVIAFAAGGALETVIPEEAGVLFPDLTEESLAHAVDRVEQIRWSPNASGKAQIALIKKFLSKRPRNLLHELPELKLRQFETIRK
jgi:glycosyltransferase involved in cell wall biosynthesis